MYMIGSLSVKVTWLKILQLLFVGVVLTYTCAKIFSENCIYLCNIV